MSEPETILGQRIPNADEIRARMAADEAEAEKRRLEIDLRTKRKLRPKRRRQK